MQKPRSQHGAGAMASGGVKSRSPQPTTSAAAHITALALYRGTEGRRGGRQGVRQGGREVGKEAGREAGKEDRKTTRMHAGHGSGSLAVFCVLK